MPSTAPNTYYQKTPRQVHDDGIRTLSNGLRSIGIANPNTGPNSDYDKQWTALGNEIAVGQANAVIKADQDMPDTATGAGLDRWLALFKMQRNPAAPSHGVVTITLSVASTLIITGQQLTDTAGLLYQVTTGGTYANQTQVPVAAVTGGSATNHSNGDILQWAGTPPPFAAPTVVVGTPGATDGLVDGTDSEVGNDGPPRARLLSEMQNPQLGGNWAQISSIVTKAAPGAVALCSVYPALLGPGTTYFAVSAVVNLTGPFSSNSFSRAVPSALVSTVLVPAVSGQVNEHAFVGGLSTVDQPVDVAMVLSIPSSPSAQPPGPGGGWLDGAPWPPYNTSTFDGPRITSITSPTVITVSANTTQSPALGGTHISWVNPSTWTIASATVIGVSGSAGAWVLTLDTPLPNVVTGGYIFPTSFNQNTYLSALLAAFAAMGPGEWTANATILQRAFRHPIPSPVIPNTIGPSQLSAVERSANEVLATQYLPGKVYPLPTIPGGTLGATAPNIYVPQAIGFYAYGSGL